MHSMTCKWIEPVGYVRQAMMVPGIGNALPLHPSASSDAPWHRHLTP